MNKKNIENIYPMTPIQQGILFHTLNQPRSGIYVVQNTYKLYKAINIPAFKQAWQHLIHQHSVLRTSFHWQQYKEPFQVVHKQVELPWFEYNWQEISPQEQQSHLDIWLEQDRKKSFNLSKAPLMRLTLIKLEEALYQFIWTSHHLILDGWSTASLLYQLLTTYQATSQGQNASSTPSLPYSYYVGWLKQQDPEKAQEFWQNRLQGVTIPTPLNIGFYGNKKTVETTGQKALKLSSNTTKALQELAKKHKITLNTVCQGIWALILSRYSGEKDVVFGATCSGRSPNLVGSESMIGLFINTLPVPIKISETELLIPWLKKIQSQQIEAQNYEYSSLVEVQKWSEIPHDLPLFESILVFENYPVDITLSKIATEMKIETRDSVESTNYPLTISIAVNEQLFLEILYNPNRFDDGTITRLLGHWQNLLEQIVANGEQPLLEFSLLTVAESHQLLVEWNETEAKYPTDKCIHQLFEEQVATNPDVVAVFLEGEQLTYRELNEKANQLAHYLQTLGVKPEVLVGICLERSLEMVVGLLGILKAGGAYLPLDPSYPHERLSYMLADAGVPVLLTTEALLSSLPEHQAKVVCLDRDWGVIDSQSQKNLASEVRPSNLAYVIYTSGSTGKPKGVMVQHHSLVNFTKTAIAKYEISVGDLVLQFASISFDASAEEIYPCLSGGGTLILRTGTMLGSVNQFLKHCQEWGITILDLPTAYWQQMVVELAAKRATLFESLRLVIIGGERVSPDLVKTWQKCQGNYPQLVNTYGPTESTVVAIAHTITTDAAITQEIPIGRPIGNTQIYILNPHLQPVPIGVPGELYIGGAGLARGYLNQPELTATKFIPNPFSKSELRTHKSEVLYKTGDLARYLPDGNIEFLGRLDNQVKIRGFRIELGEIEVSLSQHPRVQQTVIVAQEDHLIAYVIPSSEKVPSVKELQDFLRENLPYYMIPSNFVFLESFPLTPNGKINIKALSTENILKPERKKVVNKPLTELEKRLIAIWCEVLSVEEISIDDNFFALGGHSLMIVKLFTRIHQAFEVELPLQTLFDGPTIKDFAQKLASTLQKEVSKTIDTDQSLNLRGEAVLDHTIDFHGKQIRQTTNPTSIFLTGATGFLGAFLLAELLQQTQAQIYCLIRADTVAKGGEKLKKCLESYLLWNSSFNSRIIPVVGDLSQPLLGLSEKDFANLGDLIDIIYHNGAWVHHVYPYSLLKNTNVLGTQEVLRLASIGQLKPVHFISTISVFAPSTQEEALKIITEESSIDDSHQLIGGYIQSKWVAEKLVTIAGDRGLPVTIYRPGGICGHSQTGVFNANDFLYRFLFGCIQLGYIPEGEWSDGLVPVDYVSKSIVYLSQQQQSLGKAFHLLNPEPINLKKLFEIIRSFGYSLEEVSQEKWQAQLKLIKDNFPEHPLYPLIPLLLTPSQSQGGTLKFDCRETLETLKNASISLPPMDEKLHLSYLVQRN